MFYPTPVTTVTTFYYYRYIEYAHTTHTTLLYNIILLLYSFHRFWKSSYATDCQRFKSYSRNYRVVTVAKKG